MTMKYKSEYVRKALNPLGVLAVAGGVIDSGISKLDRLSGALIFPVALVVLGVILIWLSAIDPQ